MRLCIFAAYPRNIVSQATVQTVLSLCAAGYTVVFVNSNADVRVPAEIKNVAHSVYTRNNGGYDWGAWAEVLPKFKSVWNRSECTHVLLTNDSYIAPVFGQDSFNKTLAGMWSKNADVAAMTISHEVRRHVQSYWIEVKTRFLLESRTMRSMLNESKLRSLDTVQKVIDGYETTFLQNMLREYPALRVHALHESRDPAVNPYIHEWDGALRGNKFPLFKLSVLRLGDGGHARWSEDLDNDIVVEWCKHNAPNRTFS